MGRFKDTEPGSELALSSLGMWQHCGPGQASPISESCPGLEAGSPVSKFCLVIQNSDEPSGGGQLFVYNWRGVGLLPLLKYVFALAALAGGRWTQTAPCYAEGRCCAKFSDTKTAF